MGVTAAGHLAIGVLLGSMASGLHLYLLYRALARAMPSQGSDVGHTQPADGPRGWATGAGAIASGVPLRTLLWVPPLLIAVRLGLAACLGVVGGMMICRAVLIMRVAR